MAQLIIELPADLEEKVRQHVARYGYADAQSYIHELILADALSLEIIPPDRVVVRTKEELEEKLLASLASGPGLEMTAADWTERRKRLTEKYSAQASL